MSGESPASGSGEAAGGPQETTPSRDEPPTPFQMLCGGLGAQVQIALGLFPDPTSGTTETDLPSARQGIDMLASLETRTKGNLTPAEESLLGKLLTHLRMLYVERVREPSPASAKGEAPSKEAEEKNEG